MTVLRLWAVPCFLGVLAGSAIAAFAPPWLFKIVFVAVAGLNGIQLLVGGSRWRIADDLPGPVIMRIMGFFIGILSALSARASAGSPPRPRAGGRPSA